MNRKPRLMIRNPMQTKNQTAADCHHDRNRQTLNPRAAERATASVGPVAIPRTSMSMSPAAPRRVLPAAPCAAACHAAK
jgi:hypothetical protein